MKKKLLIVGFVFALLAAIPITLYLVQKQQETRTRAAASTTLSFSPPQVTSAQDQEFSIDIQIAPGQNQVSFVKLSINYDPTKIATSGAGFEVNREVLPVVADGPIFTQGNITITLSTGANSHQVLQTNTRVGKIFLKGIATTTTAVPLTFGDETRVLSAATSDATGENVLSQKGSASITITASTTTPSPSIATQIPICESLAIDRPASGTAPYSLTFTATGKDTDGTISKISFNFGDGPVQDVTTGNGIGTNTISLPLSHTYNNAGTFVATAQLVDNNNAISTPSANCTKNISVLAASSSATPRPIGGVGNITPTITPLETPFPTSTPVPFQTIPPPGPSEAIVTTGVFGIVLSVIGGVLFFIL